MSDRLDGGVTQMSGQGGGAAQAGGRGGGPRLLRWVAVLAVAGAAVIAAVLVFSAVHLLPQLRNPFTESTTVRSEPALLQSITSLSRYEAASGSFQVVVDLSRRTRFLPPFIEGTDTLFVGQGTVIAFVDFSHLASRDLRVSPASGGPTSSRSSRGS